MSLFQSSTALRIKPNDARNYFISLFTLNRRIMPTISNSKILWENLQIIVDLWQGSVLGLFDVLLHLGLYGGIHGDLRGVEGVLLASLESR